jgi:xylose isomerase
MWAKDKQTLEFLERMGPYFHMTLFHHHQITSKANNILEPMPNEMVTFEYPDGSEYSITYGKLKELATQEQQKFIEENDNKHDNNEGTE